jgi:AraC-like DNA-binding protein
MSGSPSGALPAPPSDTRGIINPAAMWRHVTLNRYPAGPVLEGIVDWFWAVSWQVPPGSVHVQPVLNHPGANISIGTTDDLGATPDRPHGRVYGLHRGVSQRRLTGDGWTVAAKTTVGGFGALLTVPAQTLTDGRTTLDEALDLDGETLITGVTLAQTEPQRVELLRTALEGVLRGRDQGRVARARALAAAARLAERAPAVTRPEHLAEATGVGVRTLQRLFAEYVGAGPGWVIRRWRVIQAAERAGGGPLGPSPAGTWAQIAAELGYSDQAHLVREFRATLGTTPGAYAGRVRPRATAHRSGA